MSYLYETHLHTVQVSACAVSRGADYLKGYQDQGYTGIFVTDHFYRGNTTVHPALPWDQWVHAFCRGYEETREAGEKAGIDVFFGWEETYQGDDYLIYGLDKSWLLEHPEARYWTRKEQFETVRAFGGCVVQAHPFRAAPYIRVIHLSTVLADAVEIANRGNSPAWDALAAKYARRLGLPVTAGTDLHSAQDLYIPEPAYGVYLNEKLTGPADYVRAVKEHRITALRVPEGRLEFAGDLTPRLPVDIRDGDDNSTWQDLREFMNPGAGTR
jgi:histidinol phosphatase-like PHP family hydrolase